MPAINLTGMATIQFSPKYQFAQLSGGVSVTETTLEYHYFPQYRIALSSFEQNQRSVSYGLFVLFCKFEINIGNDELQNTTTGNLLVEVTMVWLIILAMALILFPESFCGFCYKVGITCEKVARWR